MPMVLKLAKVGINYMAPTRANQSRASIKVREYLAAGLRVVCNPVGDAETFKDYITLCTRIEEFPGAIGKALEEKNPESAQEAQKFVERNFSWPQLVEDFLSQLQNS
jgi:glycosyltransferase involved in cell wall biosynthesis